MNVNGESLGALLEYAGDHEDDTAIAWLEGIVDAAVRVVQERDSDLLADAIGELAGYVDESE
jgi:hypothetical protein